MTASLKIKKDRYYAVINYKDGGSYKQKWISLGLSVKNNKRRAESMLEKIKSEYESEYSTPSGDMLFTDYMQRWLYEKKPMVELSTWEGYQVFIERHIIPYFEPFHLKLRELKPQHIKDYYRDKYVSGRVDGKGGLAIRSIKKHGAVIKEALRDAVTDEMIAGNPAAGVQMPAKETTKTHEVFLTAGDAREVMKAFAGHLLEAIVCVTLYYGLRRSEALGLRWGAIDFEHNKLSINHTVVKHKTIVAKDSTKNDGSRFTFDLIPEVKDILIKQREFQQHNRDVFGKAYVENDYIFTHEDGTVLRPDCVTRGFQRVLKRNGLPKMRFHDLRHSTASILYDSGWDIKDIQIWLRHASIDVTADIYTHISKSRKASIGNSLGSILRDVREDNGE